MDLDAGWSNGVVCLILYDDDEAGTVINTTLERKYDLMALYPTPSSPPLTAPPDDIAPRLIHRLGLCFRGLYASSI